MDVKDNQLDKFLWEDTNGLCLHKPEKLYHYTGTLAEADIRKILKCSNANLMEDPLEFRLGLCFLQQKQVPQGFPLKEVLNDSSNSAVSRYKTK